jgi:hypothetical protein
MELVVPSWFKGRQGKAEQVAPDTYRLTAPNQQEAYLSISKSDNGLWAASLRYQKDGPEAAATQPVCETPNDAWEAGFELYREEVIV